MRKPLPDGFLKQLESIVGAAYVVTAPDVLETNSHDETPNLKHVLPDVVVRAGSTQEVADVVGACARDGVFITARGGGTGKSGGCVPSHGGVVLSLERLNQILRIDPANLTAVVEPGVILGDFQSAVEQQGMFYPPDPASLTMCTLGGNVAENA